MAEHWVGWHKYKASQGTDLQYTVSTQAAAWEGWDDTNSYFTFWTMTLLSPKLICTYCETQPLLAPAQSPLHLKVPHLSGRDDILNSFLSSDFGITSALWPTTGLWTVCLQSTSLQGGTLLNSWGTTFLPPFRDTKLDLTNCNDAPATGNLWSSHSIKTPKRNMGTLYLNLGLN